jgi:transposase
MVDSFYSVGLDVHQSRSSLCVLDPNGNTVLRREVRGGCQALLGAVAELPRPFRVCYEASCGYGTLHDALTASAASVQVAHPGHLRLIFRSKRKNDRADAAKLAKLVHLGEVPAVHVPGVDVRSWRRMIELRQTLVAKRVASKNALRAVLRSQGVEGAAKKKLWTKAGRAWLAGLGLPEGERLTADLHLWEVDALSEKIKAVTRRLDEVAARHPAVALLRTVPGVGPRTAEAFVAYVDDPARFARSKQFGCYFGLVPAQDSSGGVERLGHITREGPSTVRKLLVEASHVAIRLSPSVRARYERLVGGDPGRRKKAVVAVAHFLCRAMGAMLKTGEAWREPGGGTGACVTAGGEGGGVG